MPLLRMLFVFFALLLFASATQAETQEMQISGVFEIQAFVGESDSNGNANDLSAPTLEIEFFTRLSKKLSIAFIFLAEDIGSDTANTSVDGAVVNFRQGASTLTIGQGTLPFGRYETSAISDPLTLLLGETSETALLYNRSTDSGLDYSVYLFNGESTENPVARDRLHDFGFAFNYIVNDWSVGAGYISNLANSDTLIEVGSFVADKIPGMALHLSYYLDDWSFFAEHVMALDDFVAGDLDGVITAPVRPAASHLEIVLALENDRYLSLNYSTADQAAGLLDPDYARQTAVTYAMTLAQQAKLQFELLSAREFNHNQDTLLSVKLSVDF